ncbi:MAG: DUF4919 domain-containing protein [Nocardioides sp.]|uniref:DUF4919 domain-containing protein n=1 Tax=Nocardioides sp. TaxID=35761 RepID=UPI003D6BBBF5
MATYAELLDNNLRDPGPESLRALREAILEAPNFRPDLEITEMVAPMMSVGDYAGAVAAVHGLMPGAIFSPSAHAALADAQRGLGNFEQAQREAALAQAALDSIISTGEGTEAAPWSVLRTSDAYDVVLASGKTPRSQVAVGKLDRIVCTDSTVWFFDTSTALART